MSTEIPNYDKKTYDAVRQATVYTLNGKPHRTDGPAVIKDDGPTAAFDTGHQYFQTASKAGDEMWYQFGRLHRTDGPALIHANGNRFWYQRGVLHREDGPAVEWAAGDREWYLNGVLHREDGPAFVTAASPGCTGTAEWRYHGVLAYSEEEFYDDAWRKEILLKTIK